MNFIKTKITKASEKNSKRPLSGPKQTVTVTRVRKLVKPRKKGERFDEVDEDDIPLIHFTQMPTKSKNQCS